MNRYHGFESYTCSVSASYEEDSGSMGYGWCSSLEIFALSASEDANVSKSFGVVSSVSQDWMEYGFE